LNYYSCSEKPNNERGKFRIEVVSPISVKSEHVPNCAFGHLNDDQFIHFENCFALFHHYPNELKFIMGFECEHNGAREESWLQLTMTCTLDRLRFDSANLKVKDSHSLRIPFQSSETRARMKRPCTPANIELNDRIIQQFQDDHDELIGVNFIGKGFSLFLFISKEYTH
jgi:hypothetical protein